jgi:hypothetical protein
LILARNAFF